MTVYQPDPIQRPAGPHASPSPLREYLNSTSLPAVSDAYAVVPRSLAETMPMAWQLALVQILAEFHQAYGHLGWPEYRVVPSRRELLVNLDEEQLAEVGAIMEIDGDGEVVYRDRSGRRIDQPERTEVLVSCLDPIPGAYRNANQDTPPRGFPAPQATSA